MRTVIITGAVLALALPVTSQKLVVSPAANATVEGSGSNTFPWGMDTFRYMQIHGDLKGKAGAIKAISFRRDGRSTSSCIARTSTILIRMGDAVNPITKSKKDFANNWVTKGLLVFTKKAIKLPDWTKVPPTAPAAFTFTIPLNKPFPYTGKHPLGWETVISKIGSTTPYNADFAAAGRGIAGPNSKLGVGCTASDQTSSMSYLGRFFSENAGAKRVRYYGSCFRSAKGQPSVVMIGFKNPNLPLPLCNATPAMKLYTDASISIPSAQGGKSRASDGFWSTGNIYFPWVTGMDKLAPTYSQAVSLDPNGKPSPATISNGVQHAIAPLPPAPPAICRIWAKGVVSVPAGTGISRGAGLVTQFTFL